MEITCPSCSAPFEAPQNQDLILCPSCGSELLVEDKGEGYLLVSATESETKKTPLTDPNEPNEYNDPLMADYARWRQGGFFSVILGAAGILMLFIITYHDYASYGKGFILNSGNRTFLAIAALLCSIMVAAGVLVFRAAGRERSRYLESWRQSPVRIEHNPPTPKTNLI